MDYIPHGVKGLARDIRLAANPKREMDRSFVNDHAARILARLGIHAFRPGHDETFWFSRAGQWIISALYLANWERTMPCKEAAALAYGEYRNPEQMLRYAAATGKITAIPKPEWAKTRSARCNARKRGSTPIILWRPLRAEIEQLVADKAQKERRLAELRAKLKARS